MTEQQGMKDMPIDTQARKAIIASRNKALALVLVGFVVLFFAITIVKMKI
jgi:hypothetical protein